MTNYYFIFVKSANIFSVNNFIMVDAYGLKLFNIETSNLLTLKSLDIRNTDMDLG